MFQQVDTDNIPCFMPYGLGGLSGKDGEHTVIDKESSPSFDIKCPTVGIGAIDILCVFATSALIFADLLRRNR